PQTDERIEHSGYSYEVVKRGQCDSSPAFSRLEMTKVKHGKPGEAGITRTAPGELISCRIQAPVSAASPHLSCSSSHIGKNTQGPVSAVHRPRYSCFFCRYPHTRREHI